MVKEASVDSLMKGCIDRYGRLDILCDNAGVQGDVTLTAGLTEKIYDKQISVNLKSVWPCMKYAIPAENIDDVFAPNADHHSLMSW